MLNVHICITQGVGGSLGGWSAAWGMQVLKLLGFKPAAVNRPQGCSDMPTNRERNGTLIAALQLLMYRQVSRLGVWYDQMILTKQCLSILSTHVTPYIFHQSCKNQYSSLPGFCSINNPLIYLQFLPYRLQMYTNDTTKFTLQRSHRA